jgi:hypothetical protein
MATPAQIELHTESRLPCRGYLELRKAALGVVDCAAVGQGSVWFAKCLTRKPVLAYPQSKAPVFSQPAYLTFSTCREKFVKVSTV